MGMLPRPATKFGTFEELVQSAALPLRPIARQLRALVLSVDPEATEVVRMGDRAATYGVGPQKIVEGYAYILPQTTWVNLGFFRGALISDPSSLLEGTGNAMRHVKIRSLDEADTAAVRELIETARAERIRALGR